MKKILSILAAAAFCIVSCTSYDEIAMWNKNEDLGERVSRLEELCEQMNSNISALQLIVEALQDNDYVTGVVPVTENGEVIGYTITFSKSGPVTIYHGKDGEKGEDGKTPVIGVKKDTDGLYYWTLDGEWLTDDEGKRIPAQGRNGKSAYELAVEKGYTGTLEQWLASLNGSDGASGSDGEDGKSAYELAVEMGYTGTLEEWLESLKGNTGADGKSAYELAVELGYTGTLEQWLASLDGSDGNDGKSAYELAVEMGYTGTLEQWLDALKGEAGNDGDDGAEGEDGITPQLKIDEEGYWCVSYDNGQTWKRLAYAIGDDGSSGQTGADGKSAYEIAVENGFEGTLQEWLESLKGADGADGDSMFEDVIYEDGDDFIILVLAESGEQIKIPVYTEGFTFELKQTTVKYPVGPNDEVLNDEVSVEYELNAPDPSAVAIECISHSPYRFSAADGKITISLPEDKAGEAEDRTEVLVFASDDKTTVMRKFTISRLDISFISYTATQQMKGSGICFDGEDYEYRSEYDTYNPSTREGKWAYTGTPTLVGREEGALAWDFAGHKELVSIEIPAGVETINENAFNGSGLVSIKLPDTLKEIKSGAFSYCRNLKEITLPESLENLGSTSTFSGSALETVDLSKTSISTIPYQTFGDCSSLKTVEFPKTITSIGNGAFTKCTGLEEIELPDAVTIIGERAFSGCESLKTVVLGTQLEEIQYHAFNICKALETVICHDETPAKLGNEPFQVGGGWEPAVTYKIYVPDEKINDYRTEWKDYWAEGKFIGDPGNKVIYPIGTMPQQ